MKQFELPEGILVTVLNGCGEISSDLKEYCPHCGDENCNFDCDLSQVDYSNAKDSIEREEINEAHVERMQWNAAIDGVESLILACACAGIDVGTDQFKGAIQTALDSVGNKFN